MDLTEENKIHIDSLDYRSLLWQCRNSALGDPWFQGETGEYWKQRMKEFRDQPGGHEKHVAASKSIGRET